MNAVNDDDEDNDEFSYYFVVGYLNMIRSQSPSSINIYIYML